MKMLSSFYLLSLLLSSLPSIISFAFLRRTIKPTVHVNIFRRMPHSTITELFSTQDNAFTFNDSIPLFPLFSPTEADDRVKITQEVEKRFPYSGDNEYYDNEDFDVFVAMNTMLWMTMTTTTVFMKKYELGDVP